MCPIEPTIPLPTASFLSSSPHPVPEPDIPAPQVPLIIGRRGWDKFPQFSDFSLHLDPCTCLWFVSAPLCVSEFSHLVSAGSGMQGCREPTVSVPPAQPPPVYSGDHLLPPWSSHLASQVAPPNMLEKMACHLCVFSTDTKVWAWLPRSYLWC
jgi:hypothetical protein